ncbi:hypothetical protein Tco_0424003 [Tanacetum coccineum]
MKIRESLNVTFDETPPPSKTSPLVDDDLDEEETIKVTGNGYLRKGQKSKPKRQNRARERKERKEKSKSKPSQKVKVNKVK